MEKRGVQTKFKEGFLPEDRQGHREAVQSPSLEIFRTQLGKALSSLVGSCLEQETEPETSQGPFPPVLL